MSDRVTDIIASVLAALAAPAVVAMFVGGVIAGQALGAAIVGLVTVVPAAIVYWLLSSVWSAYSLTFLQTWAALYVLWVVVSIFKQKS